MTQKNACLADDPWIPNREPPVCDKTCNALHALIESAPALVYGEPARRLVEAFLQTTSASTDSVREFWSAPQTHLGDFEAQPDYVRSALCDAAAFHFQELNLLSSERLRGMAHGSVSSLAGRLVSAGWALPEVLRRLSVLTLSRIGRKLLFMQQEKARVSLDRDRFTERYQMPILYALWVYCDCDIPSIIESYISDIPADTRLSPVVRNLSRNNESCLILGIDALMHKGTPVFVETNMNPGFEENRLTLFPDGDPVCKGLVEYATERRLSRIDFFSYNGTQLYPTVPVFPPKLERSWREMAAARGITLRIVDSPQYSASGRGRGRLFPDESASDTLSAFAKDVPSAISRVIGVKGRVDEYISEYNRGVAAGEAIRLPRQFATVSELPPPDADGRFPNLIVKNSTMDNARGISLHRSGRIPPMGVGDLLYEYVVPDLEHCDGPAGLADYAYILRIYIMLSPGGARCLGVRKDISSVAVPPHLEMGKVGSIRPYISNGSLNSYYVEPSPAEETAGRAFGLKVGGCLQHLLEDKYDILN